MPPTTSLDIHTDESGNLDPKNKDLLVLSLVISPSQKLLSAALPILEAKLQTARFTGMVHTAPLVNKRSNSPYVTFGLGRRRTIFWALFHFIINAQITHYSIIIDKTTANSLPNLKRQLSEALETFYIRNKQLLASAKQITWYYDNGQLKIGELIDTFCDTHPNFKHQHNFEREYNRVFQAADMLTYLDKLLYKLQNHLPLTPGEQHFFSNDDIRLIRKQLKLNRLP